MGGEHEAVRVFADLADEFAGAVELEQTRAAMGKGTRGADRDGGMAGPRVDENIAARIGGHAAHFAEIQSGGKLQSVGDGIESDFRRVLLGIAGTAAIRAAMQSELQEVSWLFSCVPRPD